MYRTIVESMADMIYLCSSDCRITYMNPAMIRRTGRDATGELCYAALYGRDGVCPACSWEGIREGNSQVFETTLQQDGRTYSVSQKPVDWCDGTFALMAVLSDITPFKQTEESLVKEKNFNEGLMNSLPGIFYLISDKGEYIRWNKNVEAISGYSTEEVSAMNPLDFFAGDEKEMMAGKMEEAFATGKAVAEASVIAKDGRRIPYYFVGSSITIDDARYIIGTGFDVTNQKRIERKLLQTQAELTKNQEELKALLLKVEKGKKEWEKTFNRIDDLVLLTDSDRKIRRCNKAVLEFSGTSYHDVLGVEWDTFLQVYDMAFRKFDGRSGELLHRPTGRWFCLNLYQYREENGDSVSGAVITLHDTTMLKQMTEELEKAYEELTATQAKVFQQEKMASLGQLAAGVAHEINNPIGFVSSNIGTLEKYVTKLTDFIAIQGETLESLDMPELSRDMAAHRKGLKVDYIVDDVKQLIRESLEGTDRVRKIVQDLKTFSRVDESQCKVADINECLESTFNIAWNEIKYKATLKKELGSLPPTRCYPQQLSQVFLNLLVNAAHAIEKTGEITVSTRSEQGKISVCVSDNGCGIAEEHLPRIFEPFFTTKEVGKGTGLGLSISYDIVKKHNGDITVESERGRGTTFTIHIPVVGGEYSGTTVPMSEAG